MIKKASPSSVTAKFGIVYVLCYFLITGAFAIIRGEWVAGFVAHNSLDASMYDDTERSKRRLPIWQ